MRKMRLSTAVFALFSFALLYGVIEYSNRATEILVAKKSAARVEQWSLNWHAGIPFWMARNVLTARTRSVLLFLEPAHFNETDLRLIFSHLASEFDEPKQLSITALSDENAVREGMNETAIRVLCGAIPDQPPGFFLALYHRSEESEGFFYYPDATKPNTISVILKEKSVEYSGEPNADLFLAIELGDIRTARKVLSEGAEINSRNNLGQTPLMGAALEGDAKIAAMLLAHDASVNAIANYGETALLIAAANGDNEVLRLLISRGADVNAQYPDNRTALMLAVTNGHYTTIRMLLESGATVNSKDQYGDSALTIALEGGDTQIISLLKKAGAQ